MTKTSLLLTPLIIRFILNLKVNFSWEKITSAYAINNLTPSIYGLPLNDIHEDICPVSLFTWNHQSTDIVEWSLRPVIGSQSIDGCTRHGWKNVMGLRCVTVFKVLAIQPPFSDLQRAGTFLLKQSTFPHYSASCLLSLPGSPSLPTNPVQAGLFPRLPLSLCDGEVALSLTAYLPGPWGVH